MGQVVCLETLGTIRQSLALHDENVKEAGIFAPRGESRAAIFEREVESMFVSCL